MGSRITPAHDQKENGRQIEDLFHIPLLLITSAVTLVLGLFLPVITLKELGFWKHTFSVLTGIQSLWTEGHYFLALVIFVFSLIFPFVKLITLLAIWVFKMSQGQRQLILKWLGTLGKWSMLDVFVVAITIVIAKIARLASAEPRIGIYFFGCSIMLAILATMRMERLIKRAS